MKVFSKRNEGFTCENCGQEIFPHPSSSRDHCNYCLYSKHVDINPGDRQNDCQGLLEPIGMRRKYQKDQIVYRCVKCKQLAYNVIAPDDDNNMIVVLSGEAWS
ncbi:RNHCP domain-containing protein [candidate division WWE3 bacterium]|uniref:RNHCP domain-containing protein n=1 Tax=candidate division WWE3 bacterium TaxID=2053526 RepID=A0A955RRA4_UNCKA|nr:RNHCP domain-containing protein [candidate division WWE3 bacterium]